MRCVGGMTSQAAEKSFHTAGAKARTETKPHRSVKNAAPPQNKVFPHLGDYKARTETKPHRSVKNAAPPQNKDFPPPVKQRSHHGLSVLKGKKYLMIRIRMQQ